MPRKRCATSQLDAIHQAKRRINNVPSRWTPFSYSEFIERVYKVKTSHLPPCLGYRFLCTCSPPGSEYWASYHCNPDLSARATDRDDAGATRNDSQTSAEKSTSAQSDDESDSSDCDLGKTCLCFEPAENHPEHLWKITMAGMVKLTNVLFSHATFRWPQILGLTNASSMHHPYGVLEIIQNLILDFVEPRDNVKEQWVVCETLTFFLANEDSAEVFQIPGPFPDATFQLVGRLLVSMLARLDREGLFNETDIPNLGLVIGTMTCWAYAARKHNFLLSNKRVPISPRSAGLSWRPHEFDTTAIAYILKHKDKVRGVVGDNTMQAAMKAAVRSRCDLPVPDSACQQGADPFNFNAALARYKKEFGGAIARVAGRRNPKVPIGGDNMDVTTWSSEKRKAAHLEGKDTLSGVLRVLREEAIRDAL